MGMVIIVGIDWKYVSYSLQAILSYSDGILSYSDGVRKSYECV